MRITLIRWFETIILKDSQLFEDLLSVFCHNSLKKNNLTCVKVEDICISELLFSKELNIAMP